MTTQLELYAAIDRVRLVRSGWDSRHVYDDHDGDVRCRIDDDKAMIADAYLDQLDRDAREEATPCPDCVILSTDDGNGNAEYVRVEHGQISLWQYRGGNREIVLYDCKTAADLRRWCAAIKVEMPDVGGRR